MSLGLIVLAAGQGTRMKSERPKVLHPLAGRPMIHYPLEAAAPLRPDRTVIVVGQGDDLVRQTLGQGYLYVEQPEQAGTGHAVLQAQSVLNGVVEHLLVLYGADPLFTTATLERLVGMHTREHAVMTLTTAVFPERPPYGRVLRDAYGKIVGLVEEADASPEQRQIREVVCGALCFDAAWLWSALQRLRPSPVRGELYLTDLANEAHREGARLASVTAEDYREAVGINDRADLAEAQQILWDRIRRRHMLAGVTLMDPATAYLDDGVILGPDTVIYPQTYLEGQTHIGPGCILGPETRIRTSRVGSHTVIHSSRLEEAEVGDGVHIGPFSHLRPGSRVGDRCHIGTSVEIKNSSLGREVQVHHFSYLGDATIGDRVNIGAGTITANFDGRRKLPTVIEDEAFTGVDTMLVAPVRIGKGARTGAGAVVTRDVPAGCTAVGVPARVIRGPDGERIQRRRSAR